MRKGRLTLEKNIEVLTKQYAFYLQFQNGYGNILLGSIYGLMYFVNWQLGSGILSASVTACLPFIWIVSKDIIRRRCYSTYGDPTDHIDWFFRLWRIGAIGLMVLLALGWLAMGIALGWLLQPTEWISLLYMSALPMIVWRYLRTPIEFLAGIAPLVIGVVASAGLLGDYFVQNPHAFPVVGFFILLWGIWEHYDFRLLARQLEEV